MCGWTKVSACLAVMAVWVAPAASQGYPVKPIRIIVPFPAAGVPREIVARLNAEVVRILKLAGVRQNLAGQGAGPLLMTPEEFGVFIKAETAKWAKAVKASRVYVD